MDTKVPLMDDHGIALQFPGDAEEPKVVADVHFMVDDKTYRGEQEYEQLPTFPERQHFHEYHLPMRPATQIVAFDPARDHQYHPYSMPLYQTATFVQPGATSFGAFDYTRSGNPTRVALETLIAGLEDAHSAFCFTSGMAALSCVTHLVTAPEEDGGGGASTPVQIVAGSDLYGGMYRLLTKVTQGSAAKVKFVDTSDLNQLRQVLEDQSVRTRLVHVESPSNPQMRITDLKAAAELCHQHGALLSVDATMMSPYLLKALRLGADIVIHSATKFLSGHSDTMAGVVAVKDEKLGRRVAYFQNAIGTALAPFDCWLLLRSIKTLALRVERAQENAEKVAKFLVRHPAVTRLHYAGPVPNPLAEPRIDWEDNRFGVGGALESHRVNLSSSHKAHRLHMQQCRGGGSVISFETGNLDFSHRLVDATRLFKLTVSFGSVGSLIEMPCAMSHASIPADQRTVPQDLIRLSIGIEDAQDIIEDLERAFRVAASNVKDVTKVKKSYSELAKVPIAEIREEI